MKDDNQYDAFMEQCRKLDFSAQSKSHEERLELLQEKLQNHPLEEIKMNKKIRKPMMLVATLSMLLCLSLSAYGQELLRTIKTLTIGQYAKYNVVEDRRTVIPVPAGLEGKLFDEQGEELKTFPPTGSLYNAEGVEVQIYFDGEKAQIMTMEEFEARRQIESLKLTDLEEGLSYFICDALLPGYLPEGYAFEYVEFYGGTTVEEVFAAEGAEKYMNINYTNGQASIFTMMRFMDEETAFEGSVVDAEGIKINGHDAVVSERSLDIQIGDVLYSFFAKGDVGKAELIKIAESLK